MIEKTRPEYQVSGCPVIRKPDSRTVTSESRTPPDATGQLTLKSLAEKVLSESAAGHSPDTAGHRLSGATPSERVPLDTPNDPLFESMKHLEAQGISVAVLDSGEMRIVRTEAEMGQAIEDAFTVYSARDMYYFIPLEPHERRMLHEFKKRFGGGRGMEMMRPAQKSDDPDPLAGGNEVQ